MGRLSMRMLDDLAVRGMILRRSEGDVGEGRHWRLMVCSPRVYPDMQATRLRHDHRELTIAVEDLDFSEYRPYDLQNYCWVSGNSC